MVGTMGISAGSEGLFTRIYEKWVRQDGDPPAQVFLMGYNSTPIRAEKSLYDLAQWCAGDPELTSFLVDQDSKAIATDLAGPEPPSGIDPSLWCELRERFGRHLKGYGHIIYDLDVATRLPMDDPEPMIETLRMYLRGEGADPHERQKRNAERREEATLAVQGRVRGLRAWAFEKSLRFAQSLAQVREDGIADLGLGYPVLRKMLKELGHRLVQEGAVEKCDDVFWLTREELEGVVAALDLAVAVPTYASEVVNRKCEHQALRALTPPPMLPPSKRYMGFDVSSFVVGGEGSQQGDSLKAWARARVV